MKIKPRILGGTLFPCRRPMRIVSHAARIGAALLAGVAAASYGQSSSSTRATGARVEVISEPLASIAGQIQALPSDDAPALLRVDPGIEWDRVSIFSARELSKTQLRDGIATLFNLRWRDGSDTEGYRTSLLELPPEERLYEQRLWRRTMDRSIKPMVELARDARLPPSHWARAKIPYLDGAKDYWGNPIAEDPILRNGNLERLLIPFTHASLVFVGALNSDQLRALADNGRLAVPWASMSGEQREAALDSCVREPKNRLVQDLHALTQDEAYLEDEADRKWVRRTGIVLMADKDAATGGVTAVSVGRGDVSSAVGIFTPGDFPGGSLPVRGSPYIGLESRDSSGGPNPSRLTPNPKDEYDDLDLRPFPDEVARAVADKEGWTQILSKLSHSIDMPVLSDAFTAARSLREHSQRASITPSLALTDASFAKGLDALCAANGYLWWRENGALFFRSRKWFVEQLYEVPPPVLARLSKATYGGTRLTVDAVDILASLTQHQLEGLAGLGTAGTPLNPQGYETFPLFLAKMDLTYIPAVLDLWAQMTAAQKQEVLSADGLAVSELADIQRDTYINLITSRFGRQSLTSTGTPRIKFSACLDRAGIAMPARGVNEHTTAASASYPAPDQKAQSNTSERADKTSVWVSLTIQLQLGESGLFRLPLALPSADNPQFN